MSPQSRIYMFILGLTVLVFVINMVRIRRLQERHALLWILAGLALVVAPVIIPLLDRLAYMLHFAYPPALLLMLAVVGLLLIIFQLSLNVSHNGEQLKILTQELGLLRQELGTLRGEIDTDGNRDDSRSVP